MELTLANAGTVLVWWSFLYLFFANIVIGLVETVLVFGPRGVRLGRVGLLVLANYASAWVGAMLLPVVVDGFYARVGDGWIDSTGWAVWWLVLSLPMVSVVVEVWFLLLIPSVRANLRGSLVRFGVAQLVTNAVVAVFFLTASMTEGQGWLRVVDAEAGVSRVKAGFAESAWVYYMTPDVDEVRRVRLDGSGDEFAADLSGYEIRRRGSLEHTLIPAGSGSGGGSGRADLLLSRFAYSDDWENEDVTLIEDVGVATEDVRWIEGLHTLRARQSETIDLRRRMDRGLVVDAVDNGFYGFLRIDEPRGWGDDAGASRRIATETPFGTWYFSSVNVVPGSVAVFEVRRWGVGQVWCLDLYDGSCWRIADGYSPAVVFDPSDAVEGE